MKSAIELAMEGSSGGKKLSDKQKNEIAEIRSKAKAKKAETEIMFNQKSRSLPPSQELDILKEEHSRDLIKIAEKMEAEIEKIRNA